MLYSTSVNVSKRYSARIFHNSTQLRVKLSSMDFKYKEKYPDAEENVEMVCKTKLCMKYNELLLNKQGIGNKALLLIQASFM